MDIRKILLFCSCASILFFNSCKKEKGQSETSFIWNCTEISPDSFDIASLHQDYALIPLQLTNSSTVGMIDKVAFSDSIVFVLDCRTATGLFAFNAKNGTFIKRIGDIGNGHGEYRELHDFSIDEKHKCIYVLCERNRIQQYSFSGEYQKELPLPFLVTNMEYSHDRFYFVNDYPKENNLYVTDMDFNIIAEHFPNEDYGENYVTLLSPFQKTENGVLYRRHLDNHIYNVNTQGEVSVLYEFDFGRKAIDFKDIKEWSPSQLKKIEAESVCDVKYFIDGKDYAMILFYDENRPHIGIYDKETKDVKAYDYAKMKNKRLNIKFPLPKYNNLNENVFSILYYKDIETLVEQGILDKETYSKDSNPILCVYP